MSQEDKTRAALQTVLDVYCGRHPKGFRALAEICRPDFWFRDPFVEIHGLDAFKKFMRETGAHRTSTEWIVAGHAATGTSGYVRWRYVATFHEGPPLDFEGMTEFGFDAEGRLAFHIDFWDSADALTVRVPSLRNVIQDAKKDVHV